MRAKSAPEVWRSSATRMRPRSGNSSRACTVVKATIVPALMSFAPPRMSQPATRYTMAGMLDRKTLTIAKNHWPLIDWLTWRRIWFWFSSSYRPTSVAWRLKLFDSRMPETLSVSCVIAVMSDSDSCVFVAMRARTCPTRRWAITRIGMRMTAMTVSCQLSRSMATKAAITVTVLPRTLETVLVSTLATPPTSFCSRDWMMPVLVLVKKLSSIDWRWLNRRTRSAPITLLPTDAVRNVCQTPSSADVTKTTIITTTIEMSTGMSGTPLFGKSPSSNARWVSSGGTTDSAAPTSTRMTVMTSAPLCGVNRPLMRRIRCWIFGAVAFNAFCAATSPPLTRPPRPTAGPRIPLTD